MGGLRGLIGVGCLCFFSLSLAAGAVDAEEPTILVEDVLLDAMAVSPDGSVLAAAVVADKGCFVKIIDGKTGKEIRSIRHSGGARGLAFSPNGDHLAAAAGQGRAKLWDCKTWKEVAAFESGMGYITSLAFSTDGKRFAFSHSCGEVYFWDVQERKYLDLWQGPEEGIQSLAWLNEKEIVAGTARGTVIIWNTETKRSRHVFKDLMDLKSAIAWVAVSPDGKTIAASNEEWRSCPMSLPAEDCVLRLWDAETCKERVSRNKFAAESFKFSPDGKLLATRRGYVLDSKTLETKARIRTKGNLRYVDFSADGRQLIAGESKGRILAYDVAKLLADHESE